MEGPGAANRPLLSALVVVVLLVGAVGPVIGWSQTSTPDTARSHLAQSAPPEIENELHVDLELSLVPERPGVIAVNVTVRNPESVEGLTLEDKRKMTITSVDGFVERSDYYKWDGQTAHPTVTYLLAVNQSSAGRTGVTSVDAGSWAMIAPPRAPVRYEPVTTYLEHGHTKVVESYEIDGPGMRTNDVLYLGPFDTYETTASGQTIRLVVPRAATMTDDPDRVLGALANASRNIRIGGRDETVTGLVAPTTADWATAGSTAGPATFRVVASAPIRTESNAWIHEYVHTRESVPTDRSMAWFTEAVATYYGAASPLRQGLTGFSDFRSKLERGRTHTDVRLADPGTWNAQSDYQKGALVLARLDLEIRAATDGTRTLADAIRRLQRHESAVDTETFAQAVAAVSSPEVGHKARRYVTTTATPETWNISTHKRHFGYAPADLTYTLEAPRAIAPDWNRSLDIDGSTGRLLPSERLAIDSVIRNRGGMAGAYDVTLRTLPRNVSESRRLVGRVPANGSRSTTHAVPTNATRSFFVLFGTTQIDLFRVEVVEPARTVTVSSVDIGQPPIDPGEPATVTATITNHHDRPARATVPISVGDRPIGNVSVVLGSGETTTITREFTVESEGTVDLAVGRTRTPIRVGVPPTDRRTTTSTVRASTTTSVSRTTSVGFASGPGFGLGVSLLALLLFVLVQSRKRTH